jgi:hypothetical protein
MPHKTALKTQPRWRRQRKRWLIALAVLAVLSAVGLLWLRSALDTAERRSAEKLAVLIERGLLEAAPKSSPSASGETPEERPSEVVIELNGERPEVVEQFLSDYDYRLGFDALDPAVRDAIRRYLASQNAALETLLAGEWRLYAPAVPPASPHIRRDDSAFDANLDRKLLLKLETLLALAEGDSARAVRALIAALAEGKSLSASNAADAPHHQGLLLHGASRLFRNTAHLDVYSVEDLHTLRDAFQAAYEPEQLTQSAGLFFRWGLELYQRPTNFSGHHSIERWVPGISQLMLTTSDFSGWNTLDQPRYYDNMEQLITLTQRPYPERFPALQNFQEQMEQADLSLLRFSTLVPQVFGRTVSSHVNMQTGMEIAATAAAIEAYRVETGSLPENLEILAPDHMAQLPQDPFADQTLRYQITETGYVVYSVGWDGVDNSGEYARRWAPAVEGDHPFTVTHEAPEKSITVARQTTPD